MAPEQLDGFGFFFVVATSWSEGGFLAKFPGKIRILQKSEKNNFRTIFNLSIKNMIEKNQSAYEGEHPCKFELNWLS